MQKVGVDVVFHLHLEERQKIVRSNSNSDDLDLEEPNRDENKASEVIFMLVANSYTPSSCCRDGDNFALELLACKWLLGTFGYLGESRSNM